MADKYLKEDGGAIAEQEAKDSSAGAADAGKIPALNGSGKIDETMMPDGIAADTSQAEASEALAAGDFVDLWNDGGTLKARKADAATSGKPADGFVKAGVSLAATATVYHDGVNDQVTGKTPGAAQYLSASTPGETTETAPSGSGNIVQRVGFARTATAIVVEIDNRPITKA